MLSRWTCKRCVPLLGAYNENALPERQAARVAAHLAACPACRAELAALQHVGRLLRGHRPPAPAPARDLWRRIQAEIAAPAPKRSPVWPVATALGAAALVLLTLARPWPSGEPERAAAPQTAAVPAPAVAVSDQAAETERPRPDAFTPQPEPRRFHRESRAKATASAPAAKPSRARIARAPRAEKVSVLVKREPPALAFDPEALPRRIETESLPIRAENPASASSALLARARDANAPAPEETAAAPPAATAAAPPAADIAPPSHVSAAASAVDEALDFERQRELFRYSRFSRR